MAAAFLSQPGTEYGPCADPCEHTDCEASRRMAADLCSLCGDPIGYETSFYAAQAERLVHARCAHEAAEVAR